MVHFDKFSLLIFLKNANCVGSCEPGSAGDSAHGAGRRGRCLTRRGGSLKGTEGGVYFDYRSLKNTAQCGLSEVDAK